MFIALAVAVVAAVVMVAVGRGSGLAPAVPDRPDIELPTDRRLGAADLSALRFSVVVRGYRMDEVDALLARLAAELAARDARTSDAAVIDAGHREATDGDATTDRDATIDRDATTGSPMPVSGATALSAISVSHQTGPRGAAETGARWVGVGSTGDDGDDGERA